MEALVKLSLPGSLAFLLIGLIVGIVLLRWPTASRWGRRCLVALTLGYLWLSLPVGADAVAGLLALGFHPLASREAARDATVIVVLDGGSARYAAGADALQTVNRASALRTIETLRVARLIDPALVIVAGGAEVESGLAPGGQAMRDALVRAGIPAARLLLDSTSQNTREHALILTRILRERGVRRFVLVTSPAHMRRAVLAFRAVGAEPVPSISPLWADPHPRSWRGFFPSFTALEISEEAVHDTLGLIYYWARGWL